MPLKRIWRVRQNRSRNKKVRHDRSAAFIVPVVCRSGIYERILDPHAVRTAVYGAVLRIFPAESVRSVPLDFKRGLLPGCFDGIIGLGHTVNVEIHFVPGAVFTRRLHHKNDRSGSLERRLDPRASVGYNRTRAPSAFVGIPEPCLVAAGREIAFLPMRIIGRAFFRDFSRTYHRSVRRQRPSDERPTFPRRFGC